MYNCVHHSDIDSVYRDHQRNLLCFHEQNSNNNFDGNVDVNYGRQSSSLSAIDNKDTEILKQFIDQGDYVKKFSQSGVIIWLIHFTEVNGITNLCTVLSKRFRLSISDSLLPSIPVAPACVDSYFDICTVSNVYHCVGYFCHCVGQ